VVAEGGEMAERDERRKRELPQRSDRARSRAAAGAELPEKNNTMGENILRKRKLKYRIEIKI